MTRRYLLCPGVVRSRTDGQMHHIGVAQLANLYGVSMAECLVLPSDNEWASRMKHRNLMARTDLIHLHPRDDGNYTLPEKPWPPAVPAVPANPYGCHNRPATAAPDCQYTLSDLGRADPRCTGCRWRFPGLCVGRTPDDHA